MSTGRRVLVVAAALTVVVGALLPARAANEIRVVRDRFGVPHVYGATAEDVAYGAGYALAQDRLWQMHFFRLVAKGRLSHLLGSVIVAQDKTVRFWTYTAAERARRFATYPADIRSMWLAWVDGINAWIDDVAEDPANKMPFEFAHFGEPLDHWTIDDSVAMSDYLIFTFGSGGGAEVRNLSDLQAYVARFGAAEGQKVFDDLIWINDPDSPPSIPEGYGWRATQSLARPEADQKTLQADARISLPDDQKIAPVPVASASTLDPPAVPVSPSVVEDVEALDEGRQMLERWFRFGSNAQIVDGAHTTTGNTGLQAGPQVGYFLPQALSDFGLHAADGSLDATGMTFAGVGPAVLIGRGAGYNWTTTTGASDLTDTFVEQLHPQDRTLYLFDPPGDEPARWERMECRTEVYELKGVPFDQQEICRTRHGPVLSFDIARGVAYAARYSWFNREGGTVEGFFRYNQVRSIGDFATFANLLASNHNMFYADDQGNIAYWHPGNFPRRAAGDLRLPFSGTGGQEWTGLLTANEVPHAINLPQGWLANWNNKPAFEWDRESGWGAVFRVKALQESLDPAIVVTDPFGGSIDPDGEISWQDLNANIRYVAFRDFNKDFFAGFVPAAGANARESAALGVLDDYDGFIYDSNGDGFVDSAGFTILGRYVSELRSAVFNDDLVGVPNRASDSALWHVLNPQARLVPRHDWLNGESREALEARIFTKVVADLAAQFGNADPRTWRSRQPEQKYTRTNADLAADVVRSAADGQASSRGLTVDALKPGRLATPGNVPNHIRMNRGTYNHLVLYLDLPAAGGGLGLSRAEHGSVISPGQNGFINLLGQEGRHSRDQFDLYVQWRYRPMPMTLEEARAIAESEIVLTR